MGMFRTQYDAAVADAADVASAFARWKRQRCETTLLEIRRPDDVRSEVQRPPAPRRKESEDPHPRSSGTHGDFHSGRRFPSAPLAPTPQGETRPELSSESRALQPSPPRAQCGTYMSLASGGKFLRRSTRGQATYALTSSPSSCRSSGIYSKHRYGL